MNRLLAFALVAFSAALSTVGAFAPQNPSSSSSSTATATATATSTTKSQLQSTPLRDVMTKPGSSGSSDSSNNNTTSKRKSKSPMFEYLKFDGAEPSFDVVSKTRGYVNAQSWELDESIYDKDYVLRGPVIGPINRKDLRGSQTGLGLREAFPNLQVDSFGYTIDPENPFRCFYFQRWRAVHENDLDAYGDIFPATGVEMEAPVSVFTVVWTPEGKIIYEQVGAVVDRLEGNTQGKAAVFGLLHTAGLKLNASPGDVVFGFIQRLGHLLGGRGRSWSEDEDIPAWWTSKSRGADGTEQN